RALLGAAPRCARALPATTEDQTTDTVNRMDETVTALLEKLPRARGGRDQRLRQGRERRRLQHVLLLLPRRGHAGWRVPLSRPGAEGPRRGRTVLHGGVGAPPRQVPGLIPIERSCWERRAVWYPMPRDVRRRRGADGSGRDLPAPVPGRRPDRRDGGRARAAPLRGISAARDSAGGELG